MSTLKHVFLTLTLALSAVSLPAVAVECQEQPNGEMLCDGKVFVQPVETPAPVETTALEAPPPDTKAALPAEPIILEEPAPMTKTEPSTTSAATPTTQAAQTSTAAEARAIADKTDERIQYEKYGKYGAILLLILGVACFAVALGQQSAGAAVLGCIFVSIGIAVDISHAQAKPQEEHGNKVSVQRKV